MSENFCLPAKQQKMNGNAVESPPASRQELVNCEPCGLQPDVRTARRLAYLMRVGTADYGIVTILSGWAIRFRTLSDGRRQIFNVLLPGDSTGMGMVFNGKPECAVQALSEVRYCVLDNNLVIELSRGDEWMHRNLIAHLVHDNARAEESVMALGRLSAEERLATFFLDLHARLSRRGMAKDQMFRMELTQSHIADIVGLTIVHTNRVLQRLRARGIVSVVDQIVQLHDLTALRELAPAFSEHLDLPPIYADQEMRADWACKAVSSHF